MKKNVVEGTTVNDRAKMLSNALGIPCSHISSMILMHVSYFSNCKGKKVPLQTRNTMKALFPELNVRWLFDGDGEQDMTTVKVPKYLAQLTQFNPEQFVKIMKNGSPEVIRQYLTDNEVPVAEFVQLYGGVYRSLFPLIDHNAPAATPSVRDSFSPAKPYNNSASARVHERSNESFSTLVDAIAKLTATVESQQNTINLLTEKLAKIELSATPTK